VPEQRTWVGAIRSADDARRLLLGQVNAASVDKANMTALATAVQQADEVEFRCDGSDRTGSACYVCSPSPSENSVSAR
jgi:hypothetical protein